MEFSRDDLNEAKRQIDSTLHKLRETIKTFESKENQGRYKSQITLARRRVKAFGIVDKMKGDIVQLAVHPKYRRMGVATEILLDLLKQTKSLEMRVINVDERDQALNAFLKKLKFSVFVKQYEMRKHFFA